MASEKLVYLTCLKTVKKELLGFYVHWGLRGEL